MRNFKLPSRVLLFPVLLLTVLAQGQTLPSSVNNSNRQSIEQTIVLQRVEEVRSSLQQQIDELKAENARLRQQVIVLSRALAVSTNAESPDRASPGGDAASHIRLRVTGSARRDVYRSPGTGIVGKVEPGSILRLLQNIEIGNAQWCLCELERGDMYTTEPPTQALNRGWIWARALERAE